MEEDPKSTPSRRSAARTTGGRYRPRAEAVRDIHLEHHPQSPLPYVPSEATYRCLAFDGGPNTLTYLRCLLELEKRLPGFANRTDLFAGTSDGAFAAAFLARFEHIGENELRACIAMIEDVLSEAIAPNRFRWLQQGLIALADKSMTLDPARVERATDAPLRALSSLNNVARLSSGITTWADHDRIAEVYCRHVPDAKTRTLGSMPRDLVVVSYAVQAPVGDDPNTPRYVQRPKVFQNIDRSDDDSDLTLLDVVLRSSALPLFLPIHDRHIDGAIFANNPAMCAIAAAIAQRSKPEEDKYWYLKDMLLLSMGADDGSFGSPVVGRELAKGSEHHWGWAKWLGHGTFRGLQDLMLILDVVLNSDAAGVNYQARQLLGRRYLRIAPPGRTRTVDKFLAVLFGKVEELKQLAHDTANTWAEEAEHVDHAAGPATWLRDRIDEHRKAVKRAAPQGTYSIPAGIGRRVSRRPQPVDLHGTCSLPEALVWAQEAWMLGPSRCR